jgi:hypothetical protein
MKRTTRQEASSRKRKSISPPESPIADDGAEPKPDVFIPPSVALSQLDRAPQLELSRDQLSVSSKDVRQQHLEYD